MPQPEPHEHVQPAFGLISTDPELIEIVERRLAMEFGPIIEASGLMERQTQILPEPPSKTAVPVTYIKWIATEEMIPPEHLVAVKLHTLRVEDLYREAGGAPRIRIEAACLDRRRVVRAADGDAAQRIALGQGIFGEILLGRQGDGGFQPQPRTPAETGQPEALDFFNRLHQRFISERP